MRNMREIELDLSDIVSFGKIKHYGSNAGAIIAKLRDGSTIQFADRFENLPASIRALIEQSHIPTVHRPGDPYRTSYGLPRDVAELSKGTYYLPMQSGGREVMVGPFPSATIAAAMDFIQRNLPDFGHANVQDISPEERASMEGEGVRFTNPAMYRGWKMPPAMRYDIVPHGATDYSTYKDNLEKAVEIISKGSFGHKPHEWDRLRGRA